MSRRFVMTLEDLPGGPPEEPESDVEEEETPVPKKQAAAAAAAAAAKKGDKKKKKGTPATKASLEKVVDAPTANDDDDDLNPDFFFEADTGDLGPAWGAAAAAATSEFARSTTDQKIAQVREKIDLSGLGSDDDQGDASDAGEDEASAPAPTAAAASHKAKKPAKKRGGEGGENETEEDAAAAAEREARKKAFFAELPELADAAADAEGASFTAMNLSRPLLKAITALGFPAPTPIQAKTIPVALLGRDICACAATGSGKTAAFMLPVLERLLFRPKKVAQTRVLVLSPTRELAVQVCDMARKLAACTDITFGLAVGGMNVRQQEAELRARPDVVVATPGRLVDHIQNTYSFDLQGVEILILDEADRLLEVGFRDELHMIIKNTPVGRTTMLFSATMTDEVNDLIALSLKNPVRLFINKNTQVTSNLVQEFVRIREQREDSREAIVLALCRRTYHQRTVIFVNAKKDVHRLRVILGLAGLRADELHGSLTQQQRLDALARFKARDVDFLVCTDLAARGLDIPGVEAVVNVAMPHTLTQYIHRVGRTARGLAHGRAVTLVGEHERKILKEIIKDGTGTLKSRVVPPEVVARYMQKIGEMEPAIAQVLKEEVEDALLAKADMQVRKAQNMLDHHDEIMARAPRQWIVSEQDRKAAKVASKLVHQGEAPGAAAAAAAKNPLAAAAAASKKRKHDAIDPATAAAIRAAKRDKKPKRMRVVEEDPEPVAKTAKPKKTTGFAVDVADARRSQSKAKGAKGGAAGVGGARKKPKERSRFGRNSEEGGNKKDIPREHGRKAFKSKTRFKRR